MLNITPFTEDIIVERYASLPEPIADALDNESLPAIIKKICLDHHLNDEGRILIVEQVVSLALMGFFHDYDLGQEIDEALDLQNLQLSNSIAQAISAKVFSPLKNDLQKAYHPITPELPPLPAPSIINPITGLRTTSRIFEEVKRAPAPPPPIPTVPQSSTSSFSTKMSGVVKSPALESVQSSSASTPSAPGAPRTPGFPFTPPPASPPLVHQAPKPPVLSTPPAPAPPSRPAQPLISSMIKPISSLIPNLPPTPPQPQTAAPSSSPVILHQESSFKPIEPKKDFNLDILEKKPLSGAVSMFGQVQKASTPAPVTAKVQLGATDFDKKSALGRTEIITPRVVHYAETPKSPFGVSATSEIPAKNPSMPPAPGVPRIPGITPPPPPNPNSWTTPSQPSSPPISYLKTTQAPGASAPQPAAPSLPGLPKEVNYTESVLANAPTPPRASAPPAPAQPGINPPPPPPRPL